MQLLRVTRLRVLQSMQPLRRNAMRLRRFSCTAQLSWQLQSQSLAALELSQLVQLHEWRDYVAQTSYEQLWGKIGTAALS